MVGGSAFLPTKKEREQTHPQPLPTEGGEKSAMGNVGRPHGRRVGIPADQARNPIAHHE